MRIVFMGTPDFSVVSLQKLVESGYDICGVYTQPDRPKNRGMKLTQSPVKEYAITNHLKVFQPENLSNEEAEAELRSLHPDLIVTCAYGQFLSDRVLSMPPYGCINVHPSLLPKYRGPSPYQTALLNGDTKTGVTIMYLVKEMDAGDIIYQVETEIPVHENAVTLYERLASLGADALCYAIDRIESGDVHRIPQDPSLVVYTKYIDKSYSPMDFNRSAEDLHNQVRALVPWPCSSMELWGKHFKVWKAEASGTTLQFPGTILSAKNDRISIACGCGTILNILELQEDGGKRMSVSEYLRGHSIYVK